MHTPDILHLHLSSAKVLKFQFLVRAIRHRLVARIDHNPILLLLADCSSERVCKKVIESSSE